MPANRSSRRRRRSSPWSGTLRLGAVFSLLVGVNVYFFFLRGGTSLGDLQRLTDGKKGPAAVLPPAPSHLRAPAQKGNEPVAPSAVEEEGRTQSGTVSASDTLASVLRREAVPAKTALQVSDALARVLDPRAIRAGQSYTLRFDGDDRLRGLEWRTTAATLYRVERRGEGWRALREAAPLEARVVDVGGTLETTLFDSVKRSGESVALLAALVDLFAWDLNFYVDAQPGDRWKISIEKLFLDGSFYKYGRVLAAEYAGRAGTLRAFWYEAQPGQGGYYNERGESVVKSLLKAPLKYVRISPGFDRRRLQPALHTERAHLGVDYAAPIGTPVWTAAAGRVTFRGPRGGDGTCVVVAHPGGMESVYMHLSKLARGLEVGESVRQKQVIGFVGASGVATGPRLHYSVKIGGHFVDPLRLRPAREAPLSSAARDAFQSTVAARLEALAKVETRPRPPALTASSP